MSKQKKNPVTTLLGLATFIAIGGTAITTLVPSSVTHSTANVLQGVLQLSNDLASQASTTPTTTASTTVISTTTRSSRARP